MLCGAGGEREIPGKVEDTGEPGTAAGLRRAAPTVAGTKVVVPLDPWALSEARWLAGEALGLARSSLGEAEDHFMQMVWGSWLPLPVVRKSLEFPLS